MSVHWDGWTLTWSEGREKDRCIGKGSTDRGGAFGRTGGCGFECIWAGN
jgi:hypothetical protein